MCELFALSSLCLANVRIFLPQWYCEMAMSYR